MNDETMARQVITNALRIRKEVESFNMGRPEPSPDEQPTPQFTWQMLERQLVDLAPTPLKAELARELVSGSRKMAAFKPSELILREILIIAATLLDEDFEPSISEAPMEHP